jgi:hypothetical protein
LTCTWPWAPPRTPDTCTRAREGPRGFQRTELTHPTRHPPPPAAPHICSKVCGVEADDKCGGVVSCSGLAYGACARQGDVCSPNQRKCLPAPSACGCTPLTACPAGVVCGQHPDGCGGHVSCGACAKGYACVPGQGVGEAGAATATCRVLQEGVGCSGVRRCSAGSQCGLQSAGESVERER